MQIKEAAATCGLTEKAIRLYEEKGLITPTYTEINGRKFRDYDEKTVEQLKTIAGLRQSFFSIEQIAAMQTRPRTSPRSSRNTATSCAESSVNWKDCWNAPMP